MDHNNAAGLGIISNSVVVQSLAERDNMRKSTTKDNWEEDSLRVLRLPAGKTSKALLFFVYEIDRGSEKASGYNPFSCMSVPGDFSVLWYTGILV